MKLQLTRYLLLAAFVAGPSLKAASPGLTDPDPGELLVDSPAVREARSKWWREARFGMFVHWGVSSVLGGAWRGSPYAGYAEHIQRAKKISMADYRAEAVEKFNPVRFNADEWVSLAKQTGMGYLIITAKHHDGFAMWPSKVSKYNIMDATPWHHDPMRDLADACRRQGIRFGFYYSHAFDWGEENGPGNDWEWNNPGGDRLLSGPDWWLTDKEFIGKASSYVDTKVIPQLMELIRDYKPDILWFDTPHKLPPELNQRVFLAVRRADPNIVINGRIFDPRNPELIAQTDYINSGDKPGVFAPQTRDWEGLPTTNNSYGYNAHDATHKPVSHFVQLLAMAAARGGNILLNAGPTEQGIIDPKDVAIFQGIGRWWSVNGESIRGSKGSVLPRQSWTGESTTRGKTVYLHVFAWPKDGTLRVSGLSSKVERVRVLAVPGAKPTLKRLGSLDAGIEGLPIECPDASDTVLALDCSGEPVGDSAQWIDTKATATVLRGMDGIQTGGLEYRAGRGADDAWVVNWVRPAQSVHWAIRLTTKARFQLSVIYDAPTATKAKLVEGDAGKELTRVGSGAAGTYSVSVGETKLAGTVRTGRTLSDNLGSVTLPAGRHEIRLSATEVTGEELFRFRRIVLTPLNR